MQNIWIFQLSQPLLPEQEAPMQSALTKLVEDWKSHGAMVPGAYGIKYNQFIVVQAEPGTTSGCSIDSMNHGMDEILGKVGVETKPANFIAFKTDAGGIEFVDFRKVKTAIAAGKLGANTTIFDSSLAQTDDFSRWEVKLSDSWLSRFLPATKEA